MPAGTTRVSPPGLLDGPPRSARRRCSRVTTMARVAAGAAPARRPADGPPIAILSRARSGWSASAARTAGPDRRRAADLLARVLASAARRRSPRRRRSVAWSRARAGCPADARALASRAGRGVPGRRGVTASSRYGDAPGSRRSARGPAGAARARFSRSSRGRARARRRAPAARQDPRLPAGGVDGNRRARRLGEHLARHVCADRRDARAPRRTRTGGTGSCCSPTRRTSRCRPGTPGGGAAGFERFFRCVRPPSRGCCRDPPRSPSTEGLRCRHPHLAAGSSSRSRSSAGSGSSARRCCSSATSTTMTGDLERVTDLVMLAYRAGAAFRCARSG